MLIDITTPTEKQLKIIGILSSCNNASDANGTSTCAWLHSGQGIEYQILAGPIFVVIFTICAVIMGFIGDKVSRWALARNSRIKHQVHKNFNHFRTKVFGICTMLFSVCGTAMAFTNAYWQLVLLRMGIAAG